MFTGAIIGLLLAVGLGESKAQGAAIGAAVGWAAGRVYRMTPAGQRAQAESRARLDELRARREAALYSSTM